MRVCLATNHLLWNTALGGHAWVFLNWALSLHDAGVEVVLLEKMRYADDLPRLNAHIDQFCMRLAALGADVKITLLETDEQAAQLGGQRDALPTQLLSFDEVVETAELFLNFKYAVPQDVVDRFARSALVDIDPGLLQNWMDTGQVQPAEHDLYFTIGETVGKPHAKFADVGIDWHYSPPPVHLPSWPVTESAPDAPFTTVTNWWGEYEMIHGESVNNEKRTNFLAYLALPTMTPATLELAIFHANDVGSDIPLLENNGWRARRAGEVTATPEDYRSYIQNSRGEFSCAKESCMVFQNAWISDRTVCYLASGKPAVVQHTGPSDFLPTEQGLFRFASMQDAARMLDSLQSESLYREHCAAARAIAEDHFDGARVMRELIDTALQLSTRRDRVGG